MAPKVAKVKTEPVSASGTVNIGPRSDIIRAVLLGFSLIQEGERSEALRSLSAQLSLNFDDAVGCILQCLSLVLAADEKSGVVVNVRDFFCTGLTAQNEDKAVQKQLFTRIMEHLSSECSDGRKIVRLNACIFINRMLESLPDEASIDVEMYEKQVASLSQRCYDKFPQVRVQAITCLKRLEDTPEVQEVLQSLLQYDPSAEVRARCLSVYSIRSEHAELCLERIRDESSTVRIATLKFLATLSKPQKRLSAAKKASTIARGLMDRDRTVVVSTFQCLAVWAKTTDLLALANDWLKAGAYAETEVFLSAMVANAVWKLGEETFKFGAGLPWFGTEFENTNLARALTFSATVPDVQSTLQDDIKAFEEYTNALEAGHKNTPQPVPTTRLCDLLVYRLLLDASKRFALAGYSHPKRLAKLGDDNFFDLLFTECTIFSTSAYDLRQLPEYQKEQLQICRHAASLDEYTAERVQPSMLDCLEAEDTQAANMPLVLLVLRLIGEKTSPMKGHGDGVKVDVQPSKDLSSVLIESYSAYLDYIQEHAEEYKTRVALTKEITSTDQQAYKRLLVVEHAKKKSMRSQADSQKEDADFQHLQLTHRQLSQKYIRSQNQLNWTLVHLLTIAHGAASTLGEPVSPTHATWKIVCEVLHLGLGCDYSCVDLQCLSVELLVLVARQCLDVPTVLFVFSLLLSLVTNKIYQSGHTCCLHEATLVTAAPTSVHPRVLHIALSGLSELLLAHQGLFTSTYQHGGASGNLIPDGDSDIDTETLPLIQLRNAILDDMMEVFIDHSAVEPKFANIKELIQTSLRLRQNNVKQSPTSPKWKFDYMCLFSSCQCTPVVRGIAQDIVKLPCLQILPMFNVLGQGHTLALQLCGDSSDEYADYLLDSDTHSSSFFLGTSPTRRKYGKHQLVKKLPQSQLDMLPLSMVHISTTPTSILSSINEISTKTLVQALQFNRLPSRFAEATLEHLLHQHVTTKNAATRQLQVLFFLVYPKYISSSSSSSSSSSNNNNYTIEDDKICIALTDMPDSSISRDVGFGIGVQKDYLGINHYTKLCSLNESQLQEYNLVAAEQQWTLCSGIGTHDHAHTLANVCVSACILALEEGCSSSKIVQQYQYVAYLLHGAGGSVVNLHPHAPQVASIHPYVKLQISMVLFALSLPGSADTDLVQPLLNATSKQLDTELTVLVPVVDHSINDGQLLSVPHMGNPTQRAQYGMHVLHMVSQQKAQNKRVFAALQEIETKTVKYVADWTSPAWDAELQIQLKDNVKDDGSGAWLADLNLSIAEEGSEDDDRHKTKNTKKQSTMSESEDEKPKRSTRPKAMKPTVYIDPISEDDDEIIE